MGEKELLSIFDKYAEENRSLLRNMVAHVNSEKWVRATGSESEQLPGLNQQLAKDMWVWLRLHRENTVCAERGCS